MPKVRVIQADGTWKGGMARTEDIKYHRYWQGERRGEFEEYLVDVANGPTNAAQVQSPLQPPEWVLYQISRRPDLLGAAPEPSEDLDHASRARILTTKKALEWFREQRFDPPEDLQLSADLAPEQPVPAHAPARRKPKPTRATPTIDPASLEVTLWDGEWLEAVTPSRQHLKIADDKFRPASWKRLLEFAHAKGQLAAPDTKSRVAAWLNEIRVDTDGPPSSAEAKDKNAEFQKERLSWERATRRLGEELTNLLKLRTKPFRKERGGSYLTNFRSLRADFSRSNQSPVTPDADMSG